MTGYSRRAPIPSGVIRRDFACSGRWTQRRSAKPSSNGYMTCCRKRSSATHFLCRPPCPAACLSPHRTLLRTRWTRLAPPGKLEVPSPLAPRQAHLRSMHEAARMRQ